MLQATVILMIAILAGASILSPSAYLELYLLMFIFGVLISSFATTISLFLPDHDSYAAVQAFIVMPMYLLSSALVKYESMPDVMCWIAKCNPMSYAIDGARLAAEGSFPMMQFAVLITAAVILVIICSLKFRKATIH